MKLKSSFALFVKSIAPAVTLEEHLAICAENTVKIKAILAEREKRGAAVCDFAKDKEWKKTEWKIPKKIFTKLTLVGDKENNDLNTSIEGAKISIEDVITPARETKGLSENASPASVMAPIA